MNFLNLLGHSHAANINTALDAFAKQLMQLFFCGEKQISCIFMFYQSLLMLPEYRVWHLFFAVITIDTKAL